MFEQLHRLQVFMSAVDVCHPLPVVLSIVQIKHGSNRVYADCVRVIFFHPVQRIGNQIIGNLGPAVIVNQRSPVRVRPLSGVCMLVKAGTVKPGQPVSIPREMCRHPVQNHTDPRPVHLIHEIHKIFRRTVT